MEEAACKAACARRCRLSGYPDGPYGGGRAAGLLAACAAGAGIVPVSGYRSGREQEELYFTSLKENGETFTNQYIAYPGTSEHQTGLAIDGNGDG